MSVVAPMVPVLVPPLDVNTTVAPPAVRLLPNWSLAWSVSVAPAPEATVALETVTTDRAVEIAPAVAVSENVAVNAPTVARNVCAPLTVPSVARADAKPRLSVTTTVSNELPPVIAWTVNVESVSPGSIS